ncbi:MAG: ATP-binding cassette domain-containing protein [Pseudonocardiaceae bacterium]
MLRLDAVSKRYARGRWVLHDVDLEIPPGEVVAMAGANGSGKSTLLPVAGRSVPADQGDGVRLARVDRVRSGPFCAP